MTLKTKAALEQEKMFDSWQKANLLFYLFSLIINRN